MATPAPSSRRFLAPGDQLGRHAVIRQIAVGRMAELYLTRTMGIEGFEVVNMFLNDARRAATLHHPDIAQVYDIGQERGEHFFSMEYVHGEDLGRLVATGRENGVPISLDCALTIAAGLCAGLHYAHEQAGPDGKPLGIVHRDVSPSNVLVSYDGAVKLVDFGIARAGDPSISSQTGLEEWDHARAQGAFFVEQHVVRTLVESGKTADGAPRHQAQPPPVDGGANVATSSGVEPPGRPQPGGRAPSAGRLLVLPGGWPGSQPSQPAMSGGQPGRVGSDPGKRPSQQAMAGRTVEYGGW